jgi:hypothetical protein
VEGAVAARCGRRPPPGFAGPPPVLRGEIGTNRSLP